MTTHTRILPDVRPLAPRFPAEIRPRGFWIAEVDVIDPIRYHQYVEAMIEVLDTLGAEVMFRTPKVRRADSGKRTVLIGFDSYAAALIAWNDPVLRKTCELFADVCHYDVQIVEGEND